MQNVVGNSSSSLREGAFLGIPAVNIGSRQNNREHGKNIISVKYESKKIFNAIKKQIKHGKYKSDKIYGDGKSAEKIVKILSNVKIDTFKSFNIIT